jgi:hypothetical protein
MGAVIVLREQRPQLERRSQMKARFFRFVPLAGAVLVCVSLTHLSLGAVSAQAEETKPAAPQVVLSETYNAVTGVYFTNIAVHKGSHKPGLVERRFRGRR